MFILVKIKNNNNGTHTIYEENFDGSISSSVIKDAVSGYPENQVIVEKKVNTDEDLHRNEYIFKDRNTGEIIIKGIECTKEVGIESEYMSKTYIFTKNIFNQFGDIIGINVIAKDRQDNILAEFPIMNDHNINKAKFNINDVFDPSIKLKHIVDNDGQIIACRIMINDKLHNVNRDEVIVGDLNKMKTQTTTSNEPLRVVENKVHEHNNHTQREGNKTMKLMNSDEIKTNKKYSTEHYIFSVTTDDQFTKIMLDTDEIININTREENKIVEDVFFNDNDELYIQYNDKSLGTLGGINQYLNQKVEQSTNKVQSTMIDRNHHLILHYIDGDTIDLGRVSNLGDKSIQMAMVDDTEELSVLYASGELKKIGRLGKINSEPGKTAYQVWREAGNIGIFDEFLLSLVNPTQVQEKEINAQKFVQALNLNDDKDLVILYTDGSKQTIYNYNATNTEGFKHITLDNKNILNIYFDNGEVYPIGQVIAKGLVIDEYGQDIRGLANVYTNYKSELIVVYNDYTADNFGSITKQIDNNHQASKQQSSEQKTVIFNNDIEKDSEQFSRQNRNVKFKHEDSYTVKEIKRSIKKNPEQDMNVERKNNKLPSMAFKGLGSAFYLMK